MQHSRHITPAAIALVFALRSAPAAAAPPPDLVPVIGRAATPNAFQPALPCTLMLLAPGDQLRARGLTMFADPPVRPTAQGDFAYLPFGADDFSFDQVNVFFHAQQFLERLRRYGLDLDEIPIYVHVQQGIGSGTSQSDPVPVIGTGLDGRNADAKDRDIIVHEMTHGVFNPRMPTDPYPLDKGGESSAVPEGLADYFAAVVDGDTKMGEYASPPNGYHDIATDPAVYNYARWEQLPNDPYSRGKVLNGALLTLRAAIGETADELTFAALAHQPLRCTPCFADAMRWADADRYGGAHRAALDAAFASRGIGGGPPSQLAILGPGLAWTGERARYRLRHHCGLGPFTVHWSMSLDDSVWRPLPGTTDSLDVLPDHAFSLEAELEGPTGERWPVSTGRIAVYSRADTTVLVKGVKIVAPTHFESRHADPVTFALTGGPGIPPYTWKWFVRGGYLPSGRDTDRQISVQSFGAQVQLEIFYSDSLGPQVFDQVTIPTGSPVQVRIGGPDALGEWQSAQFTAQITGGSPPYEAEWAQFTSAAYDSLPAAAAVWSRPGTDSFWMRVTVTDGWNEHATQVRAVAIVPGLAAPEPAAPHVFRALGNVVARGGTVRFELPLEPGERLDVFDPRGRLRQRASLPVPGETSHALRLDGTLEAGLYFARLPGSHGAPVTRFVIVPR